MEGHENTLQEQFSVFEENGVASLLFSWHFLTNTQNFPCTTSFMDHVPTSTYLGN